MQEFILRFIPTALQQDLDIFRRARLLVTTCFFSSFIALFYAFQYLVVMGNGIGAIPLGIATALLVSMPFMLRNGWNLDVLSHVLVASFLFVSTALVSFEGGHDTATRVWIAIVPLLAVIFTGMKGGVRWLVATLLILAVFFVLKIMGIEVPAVKISPLQKQIQGFLGMAGIAILVFTLAQSL